MMNSWRAVLDLPADLDDLTTMNKVGKVLILPYIIATHIERYPDLDTELFLGWRTDLATAFRHISFNAQFAEFGSRLSDSLLINIRFCAHELAKRAPEREIPRKELENIREAAWALYEDILKANLSNYLSHYLLDHLYLIIEAIDDYDITGSIKVERALNTIIGSVVTNTSAANEAKNSAYGARFWNVVSHVGLALNFAKTSLELAEGLDKLLLHIPK